MSKASDRVCKEWTTAEISRATSLRAAGRSVGEIAREMPHRSIDAIRSLLRRLEKPEPYRPKQAPRNKPPAAHRPRSDWTPEEVETCLRLRAEGLALKEIAGVVKTHSQASIGTKLLDLRTGRCKPSMEAPDATDSVELDIAQRRAWISPQAAVLVRPYLISAGIRP